jgi:hypothetical protein
VVLGNGFDDRSHRIESGVSDHPSPRADRRREDVAVDRTRTPVARRRRVRHRRLDADLPRPRDRHRTADARGAGRHPASSLRHGGPRGRPVHRAGLARRRGHCGRRHPITRSRPDPRRWHQPLCPRLARSPRDDRRPALRAAAAMGRHDRRETRHPRRGPRLAVRYSQPPHQRPREGDDDRGLPRRGPTPRRRRETRPAGDRSGRLPRTPRASPRRAITRRRGRADQDPHPPLRQAAAELAQAVPDGPGREPRRPVDREPVEIAAEIARSSS